MATNHREIRRESQDYRRRRESEVNVESSVPRTNPWCVFQFRRGWASLTLMKQARDRVALLLDSDSPFLELCAFAGFGLPDSSPSASLIAGIGSIW